MVSWKWVKNSVRFSYQCGVERTYFIGWAKNVKETVRNAQNSFKTEEIFLVNVNSG